MSKQPAKTSFAERARQAALDFALSVALDPDSDTEDVNDAHQVLLRPTSLDENALMQTPAWVLRCLQSLMVPDEYTDRVKAVFMPHEAP